MARDKREQRGREKRTKTGDKEWLFVHGRNKLHLIIIHCECVCEWAQSHKRSEISYFFVSVLFIYLFLYISFILFCTQKWSKMARLVLVNIMAIK